MQISMKVLAATLVSTLVSQSVFAAGFEKAIMFSGRFAGQGNAAVAMTDSTESLYFNPAGLSEKEGIAVTGDFSPTWSKFKGPLVQSNQEVDGSWTFSPIGAVFGSYRLMEKLGLGIGYYVSGGTNAKFEDVDLTGVGIETLKPTVESHLSISEFSIGGGYKILPGLSAGIAWRVLRVRGDLSLPQAVTTPAAGIVVASINDIGATEFNGFRLGAKYAPEEGNWGVGASWRTEVEFDAEGTSSGQFEAVAGGPVVNLAGSATTVSASFPNQISVGGFYKFNPELNAVLEMTWSDYSTNEALVIDGTVGPAALPSVALNWNDQYNIRAGVNAGDINDLQLRAGYVLTTQVTQNNLARATFASPGIGNTFVVGAGKAFAGSLQGLEANAAAEYSFASGDGEAPALLGQYSTDSFALHLGATYRF